jgi:hypothetical protein
MNLNFSDGLLVTVDEISGPLTGPAVTEVGRVAQSLRRSSVAVVGALSNVRWSRFTGQFGGKAKMDFKFDYAASFSSFSCVA